MSLKNIRLPKGRLNGKADYPKVEDSFSLRDYVKKGVEEFAVPFTLPVADATTLGGVKEGSGVTIDNTGVISADTYSLPQATFSVLGGVRIGKGVYVNNDPTYGLQIMSDFDSAFVLIPNNATNNTSQFGGLYLNYGLINRFTDYLNNTVAFKSNESISTVLTTKTITLQISADNVTYNTVATIPVGQTFIDIGTTVIYNTQNLYHNVSFILNYTTGQQRFWTPVYTSNVEIFAKLVVTGGSETFSHLSAQTYFVKM